MQKGRLILLILAILFATPSIWAQSGRHLTSTEEAKSNEGAFISVSTSEVLLPVTVRNEYGHLAKGLAEQDFIVIEDGVRQEITSFNIREAPINVILLLDASGSIYAESKSIRDAALRFAQQLRPTDRISVIQFADKVELIQDWTSNISDIKHAINWRYRPGQATHLWDALFLATDEKFAQVEGRKAIIILTDGDDTQSRVSREQAYRATIKSGASVYIVSKAQAITKRLQRENAGLKGRLTGTKAQAALLVERLKSAQTNLDELAQKTGGKLYSPLKAEDLSSAYSQVAEEFKHQYLITYIPNNDQHDGAFRAVTIAVTKPGMTIQAKEGYIAPKD